MSYMYLYLYIYMYNEADGDKTTDTNKVTIHNVRGGCVSGGILLIASPVRYRCRFSIPQYFAWIL